MSYYCEKKKRDLHNILECIGCKWLLSEFSTYCEYRKENKE